MSDEEVVRRVERAVAVFLRERASASKRGAELNFNNRHQKRLEGEAAALRAAAEVVEQGAYPGGSRG